MFDMKMILSQQEFDEMVDQYQADPRSPGLVAAEGLDEEEMRMIIAWNLTLICVKFDFEIKG